jgi:hypothetical protein
LFLRTNRALIYSSPMIFKAVFEILTSFLTRKVKLIVNLKVVEQKYTYTCGKNENNFE